MNKKEFRQQKIREVKLMIFILPLLFFFISMPPNQEKPQQVPKTKQEKVLTNQIHSLETQIYKLSLTKYVSAEKTKKIKTLEDSVKVLRKTLKNLRKK